MDDIFAKVEVLGEQTGDFALEGADAQTLGRVVPERQPVRREESRWTGGRGAYFASSRFCRTKRRFTATSQHGRQRGWDTARLTSINALCRHRGLVESGHETGDKMYGRRFMLSRNLVFAGCQSTIASPEHKLVGRSDAVFVCKPSLWATSTRVYAPRLFPRVKHIQGRHQHSIDMQVPIVSTNYELYLSIRNHVSTDQQSPVAFAPVVTIDIQLTNIGPAAAHQRETCRAREPQTTARTQCRSCWSDGTVGGQAIHPLGWYSGCVVLSR
jgi:hypothetical protein